MVKRLLTLKGAHSMEIRVWYCSGSGSPDTALYVCAFLASQS